MALEPPHPDPKAAAHAKLARTLADSGMSTFDAVLVACGMCKTMVRASIAEERERIWEGLVELKCTSNAVDDLIFNTKGDGA